MKMGYGNVISIIIARQIIPAIEVEMRIDIFAQAEMNDEAQHQAERFSMKNMQKLKIKKEHAKACSFFAENYSATIVTRTSAATS